MTAIRIILSLSFLVVLFSNATAQLYQYVGSGGTSITPTFVAANTTGTNLTQTGFGGNTPCGSGGLSGMTANSTTTYSPSGPRVFFKITPNAGYQLNVTGFTTTLRRSGSGLQFVRFAYSLDNGVTWTDNGSNLSIPSGSCGGGGSVTWSAFPVVNNITSTTNGILFALYAYAPISAGGVWQINNITVNGTVTPVSACTPPVLSSAITTPSCYGGNNGAVDLITTGGTSPFGYSWSGPNSFTSTSEDLSGLVSGTYSVTVTATGGCTTGTTINITQPSEIILAATPTNVVCNGGNTGSIDLTATGGTGTPDYSWSNSATTEDISSLTSGIYSVTVTDDNGCTKTTSVSITQASGIVAGTNKTDVLCNGGNTGSIDLTATGGTGTLDFSWSNSAVTEDISGLNAGTYTVVITDDNGCTQTASVNISEPAALVLNTAVTNVSCNEANDGSIDLSVTGGTGSMDYNWTNSATTEDISGLVPGSYSVTVTDDNGCTASASATVIQAAALTLSTVITDITCNGNNNGSIDLTATGGTGSLDYSWSNSASTEDISGLTAGTYSVTVTDDNGCTNTTSVNLNQPVSITLATSITHVTCYEGNNGAIDLTATGGTGTLDYSWSNFSVSQDLSGLTSGTYNVTVTDDNGCTNSASATINEGPELILNLLPTPAVCHGYNSGSINLTASGGTGSYSYSWSNSATTEDIHNLYYGYYTVTVTDASGCTALASALVNEPGDIHDSIVVSACKYYISPSGLYTWTNTGFYIDTLTAVSGCDSMITVDLTIHAPNVYTSVQGHNFESFATGVNYQWVDCGNSYQPVAGATSSDFTALMNGSFAVIINDGGCIDTSECLTTFNTSVLENEFNASVNLYPNPNNGIFNVSIDGLNALNVIFDIHDITGKIVYSQVMGAIEGSSTYPVSFNQLQSGIYLLTIHADGKSKTMRFIVQ